MDATDLPTGPGCDEPSGHGPSDDHDHGDHDHGDHDHGDHDHGDHDHEVLPPGVARADDAYGDYLYRPGELVLPASDLDALRQALSVVPGGADPGEVRRVGQDLVVLTVTPRDGGDVPELIERLRALPHDAAPRPFTVAPHHVLWGAAHSRVMRTTVPPLPAPPLAPHLPDDGLPGRGVRVLVVDTAIDPTHPWFAGRVTPLNAASVQADPPPVTADVPPLLPRYAGHAAYVAGIVLQHAPNAEVVVAGRAGPAGEIDDVTLAETLASACASSAFDVINLSLGGYVHRGTSLLATESAIARLRETSPDTVVVAAAGNDGWSVPFLPAAAKGVIGVGALDGEKRACFSNVGPWVDACAPGVDGISTFVRVKDVLPEFPGGGPKPCLERPVPSEPVTFDGYAVWSGTSVAAPRVAGAIAAAVVPGRIGAREAAFRLIGAAGLPRRRGLGTVVNPGRWG